MDGANGVNGGSQITMDQLKAHNVGHGVPVRGCTVFIALRDCITS